MPLSYNSGGERNLNHNFPYKWEQGMPLSYNTLRLSKNKLNIALLKKNRIKYFFKKSYLENSL